MKKSVLRAFKEFHDCEPYRWLQGQRTLQQAWENCDNFGWLVGFCIICSIGNKRLRNRLAKAYERTAAKFHEATLREFDACPGWIQDAVEEKYRRKAYPWSPSEPVGGVIDGVQVEMMDHFTDAVEDADDPNTTSGTGDLEFYCSDALSVVIDSENEQWLCDTFRKLMVMPTEDHLLDAAEMVRKRKGNVD